MKILYLTHRFPPEHFRGTEVYTWELAKEMQSRGNQVLVVSLRDLKERAPISVVSDEYAGVKVERIQKHLRPEQFEDYFFDSVLDRVFADIVDDFQPEVVHATYFLGGLSLGMSLWVARQRKLFITITDYSALCPRGQMLDRNLRMCFGPREGVRCLYCLFDKSWLFQNSRLDQWAREYLPIWMGKLRQSPELKLVKKRDRTIEKILGSVRSVIFAHPHTLMIFNRHGLKAHHPRLLDFGIEFAPFQEHQKTLSERFRIGFIGQILPHKGLHLLVEALAGIPEQDAFELKIYGSLANPAEKSYFEALGLERIKNQRWLGTFDYREMNRVLEEIDLLVVPSIWPENCPLVPKYGLLTGTRLLLSDAPGILVKAEGEGIEIFPTGNVEKIREKIKALLQSGEWRKPITPKLDLVMRMSKHTSLLEKIYQEEL